jgi:integrase
MFLKRLMYKDILAFWWQEYKTGLRETTLQKKEKEMAAHVIPFFGNMQIQKIKTVDIQQFIALKLKHGSPLRHPEGLKTSTILGFLKIIKPSLKWAMEKGYIKQNPADGIKLPKADREEIRVFESGEIKALLEVANPSWFRDMILLAYRTGMRRGEIYGLRWEDMDFTIGFLMVRRSIASYAPAIKLINPPKTKKAYRKILLDDITLTMLKKRKSDSASDWIFADQDGDLLSPWCTTKYMAKTCKSAKIAHRCFHTLRHSHATHLLSKGINPKVIQERLGHSTLSQTLDTYAHALPTMQESVILLLNQTP